MGTAAAKTAFANVLINTLIANVATSFLWFALTFWVYIQTQSVLATGIIGGAYMLFIALFSMVFGTLVDRHRKHRVMLLSSLVSAGAFLLAGGVFLWQGEASILDLGGPWFWVFAAVILLGGVIEQLRNIALSTTVTLLVDEERRPNANGLVGTVQGLAFLVTSVFSGLSIGFLGMGWTLVIAILAMVITFVHLLFIRIPEGAPLADPEASRALDLRGSITAIRLAPGLFALIVFSTFNNLIGGVYMALMDPYGLTLFDAQGWGFALAFSSTGFILGGMLVAKFGLGSRPMRTLLLVVIAMGLLGAVFMIREWWPLFVIGMWMYMMLVPPAEAAEQTIIQKVVPYEKQGRVFGAASAIEAAAAPVTAFLIAPIAQFWIIPFMRTPEGDARWGWLLGQGEARGIALVCLCAGVVMVVIGALAFCTRSYRTLTTQYANAPHQDVEELQRGGAGQDRLGEGPPGAAASDGAVGAATSGGPADASPSESASGAVGPIAARGGVAGFDDKGAPRASAEDHP